MPACYLWFWATYAFEPPCKRATDDFELHLYLCLWLRILSIYCTYTYALLTYAVGLLSYLCLPPSYAFEIPMQLSYICFRATYAFVLPMLLILLSGFLFGCLRFWATYVFSLPMLSRYQCSWASYAFGLHMLLSYPCFQATYAFNYLYFRTPMLSIHQFCIDTVPLLLSYSTRFQATYILMFALMREYISTYFYTVMVKWRLILTWYYIDGDNFRLHIFLGKKKQINSSFIKTDDSA